MLLVNGEAQTVRLKKKNQWDVRNYVYFDNAYDKLLPTLLSNPRAALIITSKQMETVVT